jgi:heme/copper-type cytochrome/quinol oxidase subunit 4
MKKGINYLYNIGLILFELCIIIDIIFYISNHSIQNNTIITYLFVLSIVLIFLKLIYQLFHFNEYRRENITNIITTTLIIVVIIAISIIKYGIYG